MVHLLASERPAAAARPAGLLAAIIAWLDRARARRDRRIALAALLEFDVHRLDDLGVSYEDVVEAMNHPVTGGGDRLAARRAARAGTIPSGAIRSSLFEAR